MTYVDFPINSHLDRLEYDPIREKSSLVGDYWIPSLLGLVGALTIPIGNVAVSRPMQTGLWRAAVAAPALVAMGFWIRDNHRERSRLKWAKIRHYIELHPEDFPPYPPRIKVGETLTNWYPLRSGW